MAEKRKARDSNDRLHRGINRPIAGAKMSVKPCGLIMLKEVSEIWRATSTQLRWRV